MRFEIFDYAQTTDGAFAPGASARIYAKDGTTLLTLYRDSTGTTTLPNPITADSTGLIHCWVTDSSPKISVEGGNIVPLKVVPPIGGLSYSVTDYDAKFDGINDDTAAIQAAINDAYAAGGGRVLLPAGTALLSNTLVVKSKVALVGMGRDTTKLYSTVASGPIVKIQDDLLADLVVSPAILDLGIQGTNNDHSNHGILIATAPNDPSYTWAGIIGGLFSNIHINHVGGNGIHISHDNTYGGVARFLHFRDIYIGNSSSDHTQSAQGYGVYIEGSFYMNQFDNIYNAYNVNGIYIGKGSTTHTPQQNMFRNLAVVRPDSGDPTKAISIGDNEGLIIDGFKIDTPGNTTNHTGHGIFVDASWARDIVIRGGYIYNAAYGVYLNRGGGVDISGVMFAYDSSGPASCTDIYIASTFDSFGVRLGVNTQSGTAHTYLSDPSSVGASGFTTPNNAKDLTAKTVHVGTGSAAIYSGSGAPEGIVTAGVGSIYLRKDGGAATTLYVKESGTGNTGWVAK